MLFTTSADMRGNSVADGYAKGDKLAVLPSGKSATVHSIFKGDQASRLEASAGESITLTLDEDVDVSRGNMLVKKEEVPYPRESTPLPRADRMDG